MPDLWLTVSRYLSSLKAVLAPSESAQRPGEDARQAEARRRQYHRTEQLVKQFMLNEGPQLQRDLKEYANKCQNWVSSSRSGRRCRVLGFRLMLVNQAKAV